jgi:hypothetical protein
MYSNTRLPEEIKSMPFGFYLMPRYLDKLNDALLETIVEEYKNDIPFSDDFPQKLHRWRNNVHNNCGDAQMCSIFYHWSDHYFTHWVTSVIEIPHNIGSVIDDLIYVFSLLRSENERSQQHEPTGKYNNNYIVRLTAN